MRCCHDLLYRWQDDRPYYWLPLTFGIRFLASARFFIRLDTDACTDALWCLTLRAFTQSRDRADWCWLALRLICCRRHVTTLRFLFYLVYYYIISSYCLTRAFIACKRLCLSEAAGYMLWCLSLGLTIKASVNMAALSSISRLKPLPADKTKWW